MVDVKSNVLDFNFSSLGICMIQYPKAQMEELFAIGLSEGLINKWLDSRNYEDNTGKINTIDSFSGRLKTESIRQFDDDLQNCFKLIDGEKAPNGQIFTQSISTIASNIINKNLDGKATPSAYILDNFGSSSSSNHYLSLVNYNISIRDHLIKSIQDRIVKFLDEYQNIELCEQKINIYIQAIDGIIQYWQTKHEITEDVAQWNRTLNIQIKNLFASTTSYSVCNQKKNFLEEQLYNIFTLAKMHVTINVLKTIKDSLNRPVSYLKSIDTNTELPSIKRFKEYRKNLNDALQNVTTSPSLSRRKADLNNDLNNNTNQIIRLFEHGNLQLDLAQAQANYNTGQVKISFKTVTQNDSLWNYLLMNNQTIYNDCLKNGVSFVKTNNLISNINIVQLIGKINPTDVQYPKIQTFIIDNQNNIISKLPAMMHLDNSQHQFQPHACLKTVILSNNINALRPLLVYKATGTDESIDLPELQNAIIYQQEYGYMGAVNPAAFQPLMHIGYNKTIVTNVLSPEIEIEKESFYEKRIPYLTKIEFENLQKEILK